MTAGEVVVRVERLDGCDDLPLPAYATAGSAGIDLRAAVREDVCIASGGRAAIPTGLRLAIPAGYEGQVRPRSGLALRHGLTLPNAPGTIDSDYRGELQVLLWNGGEEPFVVQRGDRIAQLVIAPVVQARLEPAKPGESLDETARGGGGFGSTGRE